MSGVLITLNADRPELYYVRVSRWNLPKNRLEKEISEYFRNTQDKILVPAALIRAYIDTLFELVDWANHKHNRCNPVELRERDETARSNTFYLTTNTEFIHLVIEPCSRMLYSTRLELPKGGEG